MFKQRAMDHLRTDPQAFVYNWLCNLSRLPFGFPRSFQAEELRSVLLVLLDGPVIVVALIGGLIALRFWRCFPVELWLLAAMAAIYLGGTSLASSLPRYFVVIAPWVMIPAITVLHRHLRVALR